MGRKKENQTFALCIGNKDCEDLEIRKIYQVLPDDDAEKEGYIRVIDESGEDYLYPQFYFNTLPSTSSGMGIFNNCKIVGKMSIILASFTSNFILDKKIPFVISGSRE